MARGVRLGIGPGALGALACVAGFGLLLRTSPLACAAGVELLALAFWIWAREADDAREQVPRWRWLRRPATALWLAAAIHAAEGATGSGGALATGWTSVTLAPLAWLRAAAILWGGLELVAALPLARPFSDFPGPYTSTRPWIPVALPAAGFLVLWTQAEHWRHVAGVREVAVALLVVTALLGALRAFARRGWTASLRWLAVAHTALSLVPLARGTVHPQAAFLLWLGALGGPAFVLGGELAGATPRRGRVNARLWRSAGWVSTASLAWPVLLAVGASGPALARVLGWLFVALAVAISTWIMVGRLEVAPERRRIMRPGSGVIAGRMAALLIIALGPLGLALAWWFGFEPHWLPSLMAFLPASLGGIAAVVPRQKRFVTATEALRRGAVVLRAAGGAAYRWTVRGDRVALRSLTAAGRVAAAPLRDLHTGDAQEYLLMLAGVAVLALLLPLL